LDAVNISLLYHDQHFDCWTSTTVSPLGNDQGIILGYKCHEKVKEKLDGTIFCIMLKARHSKRTLESYEEWKISIIENPTLTNMENML